MIDIGPDSTREFVQEILSFLPEEKVEFFLDFIHAKMEELIKLQEQLKNHDPGLEHKRLMDNILGIRKDLRTRLQEWNTMTELKPMLLINLRIKIPLTHVAATRPRSPAVLTNDTLPQFNRARSDACTDLPTTSSVKTISPPRSPRNP